MENRCNLCNKDFDTNTGLEQHNLAKHAVKSSKPINFRKYFLFTAVGLIILFSALTVSSYMKSPGEYDDFAKCLTEKGAVVYGNNLCSYTGKQLNFFGKSKEYLNYIRCEKNDKLCDEKGVKITPTWEFEGKTYSGVQTFEALARITGCEI